MRGESDYIHGWRIGFAYLSGMTTPVSHEAIKSFPDVYGKLYATSAVYVTVATAYKQWQLMQTMADDSPAMPPITDCERAE